MFKNMKLSGKIASLTYVLILLTGLVAFVGYQSLSSVVSGVNTSAEVNDLVTEMLAMRQQEKDFVISGQGVHAEKVAAHLSRLASHAQAALKRLGRQADKDRMATVQAHLAEYEKGFSDYQDLEGLKKETMAEMQNKADEAMAKIAEIRSDQQRQLMDTRAASEKMLNDMLEVAFDADLSIKYVLEAQMAEKDYLLNKNEEAFSRSIDTINGILDIVDRVLPKLTVEEDKALLDKMGEDTGAFVIAFQNYKFNGNSSDLDKMEGYAASMQEAALAIRKRQKEKLSATQADTGAQVAEKLRNSEDANRIIRWFLDARKDEKNYILTKDSKYRKSVDEAVTRMLELCNELTGRFQDVTNMEQVEAVVTSVTAYKAAFNQFAAMMTKQNEAELKMVAAAQQAQDACDEIQGDVTHRMLRRITGASGFIIGGAVIAIIFGVVLGFFITRSINRGVFSVIEGLTEGADQVASGSGQVASASQSLAAGASEQAAGIEEISSAMEEMASMTKSSSDNADQANQHMQEAKEVVTRANESMGRLSDSIEDISKASDETSKIIRTIDEIAFQTNLLALNAAVEAARAGEAGAGFAVVADEVRSLAMRAAEAAKDTEALIESIVKKIQEGTGFVDSTSNAFKEVTESASKVASIVAEIAESSGEQARGIEQVNASVGEVDKVTQQNAANAEESASASEEMAAQAEHMKKLVQDLIGIVGSRKDTQGLKLFANLKFKKGSGSIIPKRISHGAPSPKRPSITAAQTETKKIGPTKEDDFTDF